jgi:hypothetical protein
LVIGTPPAERAETFAGTPNPRATFAPPQPGQVAFGVAVGRATSDSNAAPQSEQVNG